MQEAQQCADALCAYVASAASALPPSECEVLYGRAGLLYALLFTEKRVPLSPSNKICSRYGSCLRLPVSRCLGTAVDRGHLAVAAQSMRWSAPARMDTVAS